MTRERGHSFFDRVLVTISKEARCVFCSVDGGCGGDSRADRCQFSFFLQTIVWVVVDAFVKQRVCWESVNSDYSVVLAAKESFPCLSVLFSPRER